MDVLTTTATWLTFLLGLGALIIAAYYVWLKAFEGLLKFFRIHDKLIRAVHFYYRNKEKREVFRPTINRESEGEE